jgi:fibronectin type 3 domain-containing protein
MHKSHKSLVSIVLKRFSAVLLLMLSSLAGRANIAGGGTGTGANVTLTSNTTAYTLSNGIVSIPILKSSATILAINYTYFNGTANTTTQLLSGGTDGGEFYWELGGFGSGTFTSSVVVDPSVGDANHNPGDYGEVDCITTSTNGTVDVHFSMLRGSPGFYVTPIWSHSSSDVAVGLGETRTNIYAGTTFSWMSTDSVRNRQMDTHSDSEVGVLGAPVECSLWTTGFYQGLYEDKYKYSVNQGVAPRAWGWMSVTNSTASTSTTNGYSSNTTGFTGKNIGLFDMTASPEYYGGGPMKRDLMDHIGITILNMFNSSHYGGGTDAAFAANETWTKAYGPYFIYCNSLASAGTFTGNTSDSIAVSQFLLADADAQATAEGNAWPYSWFVNGNYTPASGRGNVTGRIVINDTFNPNASAAGLYVGVIQQPATSSSVYDFQIWTKPYQFWTTTDANGNFTIPHVIAGSNYTLYAFGPGAAGTFMSQNQSGGNPALTLNVPTTPFSVTVTGGSNTSLGNVTWTPTRVGPTVWEIGYPNRTGDKFRHGDDYWRGDTGPSPSEPSPIWTKFLEFPFDFPNGLTYTVGTSQWATGWNFIEPVVTSSTGTYNGPTTTISFNLASTPGATASLYIALSSDYAGAPIIGVNNQTLVTNGTVTATPVTSVPSTGYIPTGSGSGSESDASIREGNHGLFSDERITFPGTMLKVGTNTITFGLRQIGGTYFADHFMFDYLRLELTGYIPPAPAAPAVYAGNNQLLLSWPVVPGATSYKILRSTTATTGYTSLASNITGPVCGSGPANATYVDTTAVNGTTYYYEIQSVNPAGTSVSSAHSVGVAPSSAASTSAPATPTGLSATPGNAAVTLNWDASAGADYYTVRRSTVVNAVGSVSYITLSNTVTGTTFTDSTPTNGVPYIYYVTATNDVGTSGNSTTATATPLPTAPSTAPGSLSVSGGNGTEVLTWNAVPSAVGYVIYRATSPTGPFTYVMSVTETTYTDSGLTNGTVYYYTVSAMNAAGSIYATSFFAAPALTATGATSNVTLAWDSVSGAANYTLLRSTTSGSGYATLASGVTTTTYTDFTVTPATTYYYEVEAVASNGTASAASTEVGVTPVAAPTGGSIAGNSGNIALTWGAVAKAASYAVHRSILSGGPYSTLAGSTTSTSFTDTSATNGTTFYYVISAGNNTVDSGATSTSISSNSTELTATALAAPTTPALAATSGCLTLSWTASTGATSYNIFRSTTSGSGFALVNSTITASPYADTGVTDGTTYYYLISAQAPNSLSSNSTQVSATPLDPPGNLAATAATGSVTLTWTASTGATAYVVKRATVSGGPYTTLTSSATGVSYTSTSLNGTQYFFVMDALNASGTSADTGEVTATPVAAPGNLSATPGNGNVTLSWSATAGASAYTIKRSTTSGSGYTTLATGVSVTTFLDTTAVNGTTYYYVVSGTNGNGASTNSTQASATPQVSAPAAPSDLAAAAGNGNVTLTWSPVAGAATYTLARATAAGTETPYATGLVSGPYLDTGVTNGTIYYYILTAINAGGTSPNSPEVTATPAATLTQWASAAFGNSTDANLTGPNANPSGDGIPNLLKYFYALDPATNSGPPPVSTAPDNSGNLLLTFHLSKNLSGVTYQIQSSPDMINWTNTGAQGTVVSDQGTYYLMQASIPLGSNPGLYLRIKVTGQ